MSDEVRTWWSQWPEVEHLGDEALEDLPFGAIKLDAEGKILLYNQAEAVLSGRDAKHVIGKNFFTEVAPCTDVQDFSGRCRDGVAAGELDEVFPYRFDFKMTPTDVWVRLYFSHSTQSAWVFVTRRMGDAAAPIR
ncbi:MAG: PAS domain-containing protein [Acidobacteriota bacterium]